MSVSYISLVNKNMLWGKSAGRCEYNGCNKQIYLDDLTQFEFNQSYIAHIIADSPGGPRGDAVLSELLKDDLSNLMLLCDSHHRLIDKVDVEGHPVELLRQMKKDHEERIEIQTDIHKDKRSHVILFGANIGANTSPLNKSEAHNALFPMNYPASKDLIEIGLKNSSFRDVNADFWEVEEKNLINLFKQNVKFIKDNNEIKHFSIFALAPQPLLIKLGTLLSDLYPAEVYQRHKEPTTWEWQTQSKIHEFILKEPQTITKTPVLIFALSADINEDRIHNVLGNDCSIWTITIEKPDNDFMKTRALLVKFRKKSREVLNKIKTAHGENIPLHIFPAMPVSSAVEFGRVWQSKADLSLIIYDQNTAKGGFIKTIEIKNN